MIGFARPGFLLAGLLVALVPLVLHLLAQRRQRPVPLPTVRFVDPADRTVLRLKRRPADLALLTLRMLFPILLGAGFALPHGSAGRRGTATIVLLDAAAGPVGADTARAILDRTGGALVVFDSTVVAFTDGAIDRGLDAVRTGASVESANGAAPGADAAAPRRFSAGGSYAAVLVALAGADRLLPAAESASAALVTVPRWTAWGDGVAAARAVWPGQLRVVPVEAEADPPSPPVSPDRGTAHAVGEGAVYVRAALLALGYRLVTEGEAADVLVVAGSAPGGATVDAALASDATVVVAGLSDPPVADAELAWRHDTAGAAGASPPTPIDLGGGLLVSGAAARIAGEPAAGAEPVAYWIDGRPAAAAVREGDRCMVYLAAPLGRGALPLQSSFPVLVDRLVRGCDAGTTAEGAGTDAKPLDAGALALLRGGGEANVPLAVVGSGDAAGTPLVRVVLLLALAVAAIEAWLVYGRKGWNR